MDSMDSIDLLHKIAKTPNILGGGGGGGTGGWMTAAAEAEPAAPHANGGGGGHTLAVPPERPPGAAAATSAQQPRHKLVKQKSLNRTLSTSVLRIKKKRSFWSSA